MLRIVRRKPDEAEAWQFHGTNISDLPRSWGPVGTPLTADPLYVADGGTLMVDTLSGAKEVYPRDWIVKTDDGAFSVLSDDEFKNTWVDA